MGEDEFQVRLHNRTLQGRLKNALKSHSVTVVCHSFDAGILPVI